MNNNVKLYKNNDNVYMNEINPYFSADTTLIPPPHTTNQKITKYTYKWAFKQRKELSLSTLKIQKIQYCNKSQNCYMEREIKK